MTAAQQRACTALVKACKALGWQLVYPMPRRSRTLPAYVLIGPRRTLTFIQRNFSQLDLRMHVKPSELKGAVTSWTATHRRG